MLASLGAIIGTIISNSALWYKIGRLESEIKTLKTEMLSEQKTTKENNIRRNR